MTDRDLNQAERGESPREVFVLFSGHNDRAVITLCRFFATQSLPFMIVCTNRTDAIMLTDWSYRCIISRIDRTLDVQFFAVVLQAVKGVFGDSARPVYCPTTEFMNNFVLHERAALQQLGWAITLPAADVYKTLTSKSTSQGIVAGLIGVFAPSSLNWADLRAPCVIKPRNNVFEGAVYYPRLCRTEDELMQALIDCDPQHWFAQTWVDGQSYYLCAYITKDGKHAHFWQQNLLQQPGGKSIVLARSVPNPGIAVAPLFQGLIDEGFNGPFMMEIIQDDAGRFHYIEINPRFWGPLQLALDACPDILTLFVHDAGIRLDLDASTTEIASTSSYWYAWQKGALLPGCRRYPLLEQIEREQSLKDLLNSWDIYARPDTKRLHGKH
jgi:hypothetical protein